MTNKLEQMLQELHHETAQYFAEELKKAREDSTYVLPPSLLSAVTKFLKDNDITCEIREGTAIKDFTDEVSASDVEFLQMVK
jgi:hypothetical protein